MEHPGTRKKIRRFLSPPRALHAENGARLRDAADKEGQSTGLRPNPRRPVVPRDLIPRPGLTERLERSLTAPLTVLSAPAGFGKTTLVSAWAAHCPCPVAWVTLDQHTDVKAFVRLVVDAVQSAAPDACSATLGLLRLGHLPDPAYLGASLADDLAELAEPMVIVLDDFHGVHDTAIPNVVAALLKSLRPSVHLVIATRAELPAPLAALRVRGMVAEIGASHLRFSIEETRSFLDGVLETTPSDEVVAGLASRTEGWPAGLRLAALVLGEQSDHHAWVQAFALGSHPYVRGFLIDDVLAAQPLEMQDILTRSSILDRFCADELQAVLSPELGLTGDDVLQRLVQGNLFVVQLGTDGKWFRYHQLFQEALQEKLRVTCDAASIGGLHSRAAGWLAAEGLLDDAVHHSLAAGRMDDAALLVEANMHPVLNRGDWASLESWIDLLPPELTQARPALLLARAWTLHFRDRYDEVGPLLQAAVSLLDESNAEDAIVQSLRAEVKALQSMVEAHAGAQGSALQIAEEALAELPPAWTYARGFAFGVASTALQRLGRADEAAARLIAATEQAKVGDACWQCHLLTSLARLHWGSLDLARAVVVANQLSSLGARHGLANSEALGHRNLGLISYERDELPEAVQHFSAGLLLRDRASFSIWTHAALGLALTYQAQGRVEDARETIQELEDFVREAESPAQLSLIHSFQARLALLQGDVETATQLLRGPRPEFPLTSAVEMRTLTRAAWLLALGTEDALRGAAQIAFQLAVQGDGWQHERNQIQGAALSALVLDAQGASADALASLEWAVSHAERGGLVRTFVDLGPPMQVLLTRLAAQRAAFDPYLEQLLSSFANGMASPAAPAIVLQLPSRDSVQGLTWREQEVLELLGERLSNKEIAERLVVSPLTVKRHTISVYRKLAVPGRREAVARATTLRLLLSGDAEAKRIEATVAQ